MKTTRRRFLATGAFGFGATCWLHAAEAAGSANAFSPIKTKLAAGKDAVLFINGDSTSYEPNGAYFLFAKAIGDAMDSKVILHRWAEWKGSGPTGPKEYEAPVTLRNTGKATLTVYLATLPGSVPTDMFAGARRPKAIDALPPPDCCILHHGHNMRGFPQAMDGDRSSGRGIILAAIGMTSIKWPEVPQAITNQNPWQAGDEYKTVLESITTAAAVHPSLTLIDSHSAFVAAGKTPDLYRNKDVIHPSDSAANHKGAQLVADALLASWNGAATGKAFATPSWPAMPGTNLISSDLSSWTAEAGAKIAKSSDGDTIEVRPNGSEKACVSKALTPAEMAAIAGKTISITALVRSAPSQTRALGSFVCQSGGALKTFVFLDRGTCKDGWMLLVCSGIPVDANQTHGPAFLRYFPAFSTKPPESDEPLLIRKAVITEGELPKGIL